MGKEKAVIMVHMGDAQDEVQELSFEDLLHYKEIVIVEGITKETAPRVVELIHRLGYRGYDGRVIVRLQKYCSSHWAYYAMVKDSDGVQYTLNYPPKHGTAVETRNLCQLLEDISENKQRYDLLRLDPGFGPPDRVEMINYGKNWAKIQSTDEPDEDGDCQAAYCLLQ